MSKMGDMLGHLTERLLQEEVEKNGGWNEKLERIEEEIYGRMMCGDEDMHRWISSCVDALRSEEWKVSEWARENLAAFLVRLSKRKCSMEQAVKIVDEESELLTKLFRKGSKDAVSGN